MSDHQSITANTRLGAHRSLLQFDRSDNISVLKISIEYSFVFFKYLLEYTSSFRSTQRQRLFFVRHLPVELSFLMHLFLKSCEHNTH